MHTKEEKMQAFGRLLDIMDDLREKCPWDRKQTFDSLRHLTIEEVYELSDAILDKDYDKIKEELGDILLHMVFYAKLGEEKGAFDIADVAHAISDKLIKRHPHIYGDVKVADADEVKRNWEALKMKEGKKSVLEGVPRSLPAMIKAMRMQEKAAGAGFDWNEKGEVWEKVQEELKELEEAVEKDEKDKIEEEFGDVLFSLVNYARFLGINPETALEKINRKFKNRFEYIEQKAAEQGKQLRDMDLAEMDRWWDEHKRQSARKGED
ncbi:MAG: nucleoside triphosphate pyrophosphohydrolase [Chlorobi bacterium]|nr:nucleoside triphosphate pyrophosphohydrolase [Chlorobiota bacterium]